MTTCSDCRYFRDVRDDIGHCRRYAPRPMLMQEDEDNEQAVLVEWPIVDSEEWCGDWAASRAGFWIVVAFAVLIAGAHVLVGVVF